MTLYRDTYFGGNMSTFIKPFGAFLKFLYDLTGNYGWALIIFTVVINMLLLPLNIKQQKSSVAMQKIQPKMVEIQKKYEYDKEKQSQEMMKLYKEYNINPMSGCLPILIQLPIILILYQAVLKPLTYMFGPASGFTPEVISNLMALGKEITGKAVTSEIALFSMVDQLGSAWPAAAGTINFNFFGLALEQVPRISVPSLLWVIPVLCGLTTYALSAMTTAQSAQNSSGNDQTANTMKSMQTFMPFMTAFFAFTLPAALGFYWTISNLVRMAQQFFLNNKMKKEIEKEKEAKANEPKQTVHPSQKKKRRK